MTAIERGIRDWPQDPRGSGLRSRDTEELKSKEGLLRTEESLRVCL